MNWMTTAEPRDAADDQLVEDSEPTSMSLNGIARGAAPGGAPLAGEFGVADDADKPERNLLGNSTAVLIGIAVIAVASLGLMRWSQGSLTNPASSAVTAKIDTALAKLAHPDRLSSDSPLRPEVRQAMFQNTDAIVAMFTSDPTENQVPLQFTKKNPFRIDPPKAKQLAKTDPDAAAKARAAELAKLKQAIDKMKLQSVMGGATKVAVIDGNFYKVGSKLDKFTVTRIDRFAVELTADKQTFKLTMNQ